MRRILAIIVLAVILVLAISVPALAKPSDPPNAYGQDVSLWARWYQSQHNVPYGWMDVRWTAWYKWYYPDKYDNRGDYVAQQKEAL